MPLHGESEIVGMLESALEAREQFVIMELGAGWGPWISLGAQLARNRGLAYRLIGVEAASEHIEFIKTHLRDNGVDPEMHIIVHGIAGPVDGTARFPKLRNASSQYGAAASYSEQCDDGFESLRCVSVATLLRGEPIVDILHCDIQGAEVEVLEASIVDITGRVRRVVVGTHGRGIEERLFDIFSRHGWSLQADRACAVEQREGKVCPTKDGEQLWVNPQLRHR
jgi:FkbM family methyltransferase